MIVLYLSELASALGVVVSGDDVKLCGCCTDTRLINPGAIYVALCGERFDGHDFVMDAQKKGAGAVIVEKPVACDLPILQVADTRKALGDLARFWLQRFDLPLVAITGSNGKTTTKEMLRAILAAQGGDAIVLANEGNFNNDIGVPLTLFNLHAEHRYAVIEMGANHAGEIAYLTGIAAPSVAMITQCAPAHLEGFGSVKGVALAKGEIFSNLKSDGMAVINIDDDYADLWRQLAAPHQICSFALDKSADVMAADVCLSEGGCDFSLSLSLSLQYRGKGGDIAIHLPLPGRHNVMNALAASACALACGCSLVAIQQGLQNMQPVKGRLQRRAGIDGIRLIDDTYNANPTSLNAALAVLVNNTPPFWLVLGDMNELGNESVAFHREAGKMARDFGVVRLWAIGDMSRYAVEGFGEGAEHFDHHDDLIKSLCAQIQDKATVLIKGSRGMQMEKVVNALQD